MLILFTDQEHRACKIWDGSQCIPYSAGVWFTHANIPISSIHELSSTLTSLQECPQALVIRGGIRDQAPEVIRRRYRPTSDYQPWIDPSPQNWICLDFDSTTIPFDPNNPATAIASLVSSLPEGLKEASCHWHLSASQHTHSTLRCHLWFFLDRPYSDAEIKQALKLPGLDHSLYSPVQPHFVADPVFQNASDPLPIRSGLLRGITDTAEIKGLQGGQRLRDTAQEYLRTAEREIRAAISNKRARHPAVNKWAFKLGKLCPHLLSESEVFQRLFAVATESVADQAGMPPDRAQDEIARALQDGKKEPELVGEEWKGLLKYGKGFEISPTIENIITILTHDPRWEGALGWNVRGQAGHFRRNAPFVDNLAGERGVRPFEDSDEVRLANWFGREYGVSVQTALVYQALLAVAKENPFDPVIEYLDELEWDNIPRLPYLADAILGDPSKIASEALTKWLISAVKRAYEPACQADYMIILEGDQGLRKSSFLEWLAGDHYRSLGSDLSSKDSVQKIQGGWIIDLAELQAVRKSDIAAIKDFLTRKEDCERFAYGKLVKGYRRRCVVAGTVNPDIGGYLKDPTGNRRIWPITVARLISLPPSELRDQIWAEARDRYRAGESSWELSPEAEAELSARLATRLEDSPDDDPWFEPVRNYLATRSRVTVAALLEQALTLPADRRDHRAARRLGRLLRALHWVKSPDRRSFEAPPEHVPIARSPVVVPLHRG